MISHHWFRLWRTGYKPLLAPKRQQAITLNNDGPAYSAYCTEVYICHPASMSYFNETLSGKKIEISENIVAGLNLAWVWFLWCIFATVSLFCLIHWDLDISEKFITSGLELWVVARCLDGNQPLNLNAQPLLTYQFNLKSRERYWWSISFES